jgi:NADH:ubiquinone oxidoreductase subunit 5 (subunit L)/multisubunit Na+/H+ antiporter MnhA subunit
MVTAGVLLLIKMSPLLNLSDLCLNFLLIIGSLTAVFAASTATAQTDIKKVIAFSTCSQLGYMFMSCGAGHFSLAFFHLLTHAFFKALLFLSAGVVIHTLGGEQDLRKMGGLQVQIPFIFTAMGIASASLSGIPYLSGYYSKDLIIGVLCLQQT